MVHPPGRRLHINNPMDDLVTDATLIPPRKSKIKHNKLDTWEPFLALKHMILERKLKPMQQVGIYFTPETNERLGMKLAGRVAMLRVKALVKQIGAEADYAVSYYQTPQDGVWFLKVTYEPRMSS